MTSFVVPEATARWLHLVSVLADIASRRARGESIPEGLIGAHDVATDVSAQSRRTAVPMSVLAERLELSLSEELAVWTLVAHQLDTRVGTRIEALGSERDPTLGALAAIAYQHEPRRCVAELSPHGRLMRHAVIDHIDARAVELPFARRTVRVADRILDLALASYADPLELDATLRGVCRIPDKAPALGDLAIDPEAVARVREFIRTDSIVLVAGRPDLGRRTLLLAAAAEAGIDVLEVDAARLGGDAATVDRQLRAVVREARLLRRVPLLHDLDALLDESGARVEIVARLTGPVYATCGMPRPPIRWQHALHLVELKEPTAAQRAALWRAALDGASESDGDVLANRYPLAPALIQRAGQAAVRRAADGPMQPDHVHDAVRAVVDDRLGRFARRIATLQSWDDISLPRDHLVALLELVARVRSRRRVHEDWGFAAKVGRGLGTIALLSGAPGTGKTMVAGIIARELGLPLYQVDSASIVSKWIGETQKHLAELFDAAEAGHAIVLFDEADSMFGKRTDVRSSNDRHANLETNYLLQRLEAFTGVCMLTTNHETSIDPAFQRRLSVHVRFEMPEMQERAAIWRALVPAGAAIADGIDFDGLARRYAMSGGYIRNAMLRAAFVAADEGEAIGAAHLDWAARVEYEAIGKLAFEAVHTT